MSREHRLDASRIHHDWDRSREPALVIRPGDVVRFELPMAGERQVFETSTVDEVVWDFETIYNLGGPIFVEGASPGDTLEVEILELEPGPWGWATIIPGLGLLPDDFADPYLKIFDLRDRSAATVAPGVEVPLQPFLGTMGVPTDEPGRFEPFPPHKGGGNVDCRHLIAGSTLWLPVWCEGALFSCGDPHAAQGDGEVCVTAIECGMDGCAPLRPQRSGHRRSRIPRAANRWQPGSVPRDDGDRSRPDGGRAEGRAEHDRLARRRARIDP